MKVLVAEDDKFLMKLYESRLSEENYQFITAFDGIDALAKIKTEKPDLVLLDVMMPKKNGFDVLAEMKQDETLKTIPVIILSNLGQDSDVKKGLEMGAVDYVVKSNISIEDLLEKVRKYLFNPLTKSTSTAKEQSSVPGPVAKTVLCSGCAHEIPADAHFCPNCGKQVA